MSIIGHTKEREFLQRVAASAAPARNASRNDAGGPAQAYIFSGPDKIGKFLIAEEFADALAEKSSIDISVIEPEQEERDGVTKERVIPVEAIRELKQFLSSYPSRGKFRIGIIRDAHRLAEGAQNALLKTLEDPADSAIVILITHEPGRILDTVKSRSQRVSFEPVAEEAIASGMKDLFPKGTSVESFFFSLGRPGLLIEAQRDMKAFEKKKIILRQLFRLASLPVSERLALSEQFGKNVPQAIELCEWYLLGAREQLKKNGDAESVREKLSFLGRMNRVLDTLKTTQANPRLAFDTLFLSV